MSFSGNQIASPGHKHAKLNNRGDEEDSFKVPLLEADINLNLNRADHYYERSYFDEDLASSASQFRSKSFANKLSSFFGFLPQSHEFAMRIMSALFYGITSFLIIVVNKIVLTNYK